MSLTQTSPLFCTYVQDLSITSEDGSKSRTIVTANDLATILTALPNLKSIELLHVHHVRNFAHPHAPSPTAHTFKLRGFTSAYSGGGVGHYFDHLPELLSVFAELGTLTITYPKSWRRGPVWVAPGPAPVLPSELRIAELVLNDFPDAAADWIRCIQRTASIHTLTSINLQNCSATGPVVEPLGLLL